MRTCRLFCTAVVSTLLALGCSRPEPGAPPVARREAVPEIFHGVSLQDPYRWMEKAENAAELERWMLAQGGYAQTLLAGLPGREAWYRRLLELYQEGTAVSSVTVRCGQLFYLETGAGESIARLVHRDASGQGKHRQLLGVAGRRHCCSQHHRERQRVLGHRLH